LIIIYRSGLSIQARKNWSKVTFSIPLRMSWTASRSAPRSGNSCSAQSCLTWWKREKSDGARPGEYGQWSVFYPILLQKVQTHFRSMGHPLSAWTINFWSVLPTWVLSRYAHGIGTFEMQWLALNFIPFQKTLITWKSLRFQTTLKVYFPDWTVCCSLSGTFHQVAARWTRDLSSDKTASHHELSCHADVCVVEPLMQMQVLAKVRAIWLLSVRQSMRDPSEMTDLAPQRLRETPMDCSSW
jgi:hypothetical protein